MYSRPFGWRQCWNSMSLGEFRMCFLITSVYEHVLDHFITVGSCLITLMMMFELLVLFL
jgi:hypothetical protein